MFSFSKGAKMVICIIFTICTETAKGNWEAMLPQTPFFLLWEIWGRDHNSSFLYNFPYMQKPSCQSH